MGAQPALRLFHESHRDDELTLLTHLLRDLGLPGRRRKTLELDRAKTATRVHRQLAQGTIAGLAHRFGTVGGRQGGRRAEIIRVRNELSLNGFADPVHCTPRNHVARAPNGADETEANRIEFRPRHQVNLRSFQSFSTDLVGGRWSKVGDADQGAYTLRAGTDSGPHIEGPGCLISLPDKL